MLTESPTRVIALVATGLLVGWQAVAAAVDLVATRPHAPARLRFGTDRERIAALLGADTAIHDALVRHVPATGLVVVTFEQAGLPAPENLRLLLLSSQLRSLAYPRRLIPADTALRLAADGRLPEADAFVLDLRPAGGPARLELERVAGAERFALYRRVERGR